MLLMSSSPSSCIPTMGRRSRPYILEHPPVYAGAYGRIRLFCLVLRAALVTVVGAVVVQFNFYVRLLEFAVVGQAELEVFDADAALAPHGLVISLDG